MTSYSIMLKKNLCVDNLLQQIDDFQRTENEKIIERLTEKNILLQKQIVCYIINYHITMNLLQKVFETTILIKMMLKECHYKNFVAKTD